MNSISLEQLKSRLDRQEPVQLVMALGQWAYERLHIPGSLIFTDPNEAVSRLSRDQEVIVYCTNPACAASFRLYYRLKHLGFTKLARFSGGIEEWMDAGLPVEGSLAKELAYAAA